MGEKEIGVLFEFIGVLGILFVIGVGAFSISFWVRNALYFFNFFIYRWLFN